jgi:subtilisin family serine protease
MHRIPRRVVVFLIALALPHSLHADPSATLIVQSGAAPTAAWRTRCEALGLRVRGPLAEAPPAAASRPDARRAPARPFTFDPAHIWRLEARDSLAAGAALTILAADPEVEWVERDVPRELVSILIDDAFPNDALYRAGRQWGLHDAVAGADVRAPEAWATSTGGNAVRLALADSGVDPGQPELAGTMPDGSPRLAFGRNVTEREPASAWADSTGHGTAVAGVMAARTNEGVHFDSLGVAGVCGGDGAANAGCRIVPIKVLPGHSGTASGFDVALAVLHATAVGARAVNLSLAGPAPSRVERLALQEAITHGCVVVAAAGNRGAVDGAAAQYPAAYAADGLCIQVGASDATGARAVFSSFGPGLDLLAPGVDIWTTSLTYRNAFGLTWPGVVVASGTSLAAPFVTGAVGLLAAVRPELTDTDFQHVLRETARDIGATGPDRESGWGRLDLAAALAAVRPEVGIWHDEVAAQTFEVLEIDTLVIGEGGFGTLDAVRGARRAERIAARATVVLPDSFLAVERAWTRVGGTTTARGDFRLETFVPWANVVPGSDRTLTLQGYLYRVLDTIDAVDGGALVVPLPQDQARFGFTVIGPVRRPAAATPSIATPTVFRASPNPFVDRVRIQGRGGDRIVIVDVAGRVVHRARIPTGAETTTWDGRGPGGRAMPPGLYFVRGEGAAHAGALKLVRLE